ncbi:putative disease resistance RPP13-like protein 1 [Alnus glutinosa]|uniref:putative disease resistance RPP13-like protein 1 n=1 Tax=Alnus glutinosa TaxID=3517 RepID=UPI002D795FAF|nr:putative disease resistance RPP13-like protein 1 [Alnus glutinosa]
MAEIATIFLSPFLQQFFERLASGKFIDFFQQRKLSHGLLKKLKTTFLTLNAAFEDAEELQVMKPAVKEWLDELKDAIYDAEDILDEIATEALPSELDAEFQTTASKVRKLPISAFRNSLVQQIEPKIKEILGRLESLAQQKDLIGLKEGVRRKSSERLPTTSLVEESDICGRNDEKEAIIKMLLSDDISSNEMCVIVIVGMGGIGKTTLAQSVYKNDKVNEHFNIDAWVYVSEEFDVFKVTKIILEVVTLSPFDVTDLNQLQLKLKECLVGKKFLLVLDDVWNENYVHWEVLSKPFKFGAQGSKVIVTTRNRSVASVMRASSTHPLKELPEEDCWSLFAKHAFHDGNSNAHGELEVIGRKIIEKCGGLPLAVKTICALLRSKPDVDEWEKILKSELWDLPIDEMNILPALRLSYKYLPSHLKRCFAYSSIFPKNYAFKKDQLIMLWMAEGFLQQRKSKTMEEVGNEYFFTLESRSLFQKSSDDKSRFKMHDLVSDLTKFISRQFILRLEGDCFPKIENNTRHLSYFSKQNFHSLKKFETLHKAKRLRTFLHLDMRSSKAVHLINIKVVHDLLPTLRCLRVLSLSNYQNITELPDSIDEFKYLRYLDLSFTSVKRLPNFICKLCNLQTLILLNCIVLSSLPRDVWKLINLRHLDITETGIKEMPIQLGRQKCHYGNRFSEGQRSVLDSLRPHTNLKSLTIQSYGGKSFSDWVGHPSFSNVASLYLESCKYCSSLPLLGQLPSLQNLSIVGFDEVVRVGHEFCGSSSSSVKPFAALKVLRMEVMPKWEEWVSFGDENGGGAFPQLEKLSIRECPKLSGGLPVHLSSLSKLDIINCPQLVALLPLTPTICELELSDCNEMLLKELPTKMEKHIIKGFNAMQSLPKGMIDSDGDLPFSALKTVEIDRCKKLELSTHLDYSSLENLCLRDCGSLKSFPLDLFPKLYHIEIYRCKNLESLTVPENNEHDLVTLHIHLSHCPNFVSFPKGGLRAPNLTSLRISDCENLKSLPEKMHILLLSLERLHITYCPEIELFPVGQLLPSNLESIYITGCEKLIVSRMQWGLQNLPILKHFSIGGKNKDLESFPETQLLPTSLTYLFILDFPNLKSLDKKGLQHLIALEEFHIWNCPKLEYMPEQGLPASLSILEIFNCPLLKKEWRKIAHVEHIQIE